MSLEDLLAQHVARMGQISQQGLDQSRHWLAVQNKFIVDRSVEAANEIDGMLAKLEADLDTGIQPPESTTT